MLHELLLVLSGHPGDLFVPFPPPPFVPNTFAIPPDFPLLHDAERRALDRLAHLGWLYKQIVDFIQTVQNGNAIGRSQQRQTNMDNGRELPRGAYILAMCTSAHESLGQYRRVIVDCEERILNKDLEAGGGCVPISHIMSLFARWELILQPLNRLMQDIAQCPADWHGCQLLDLLMERSNTGVGEVRQVMEKMARDVHAVMYKQMASWMVYGYLADPDEEFFITPYQPTPPSSPTGAGPTTAPRVSNWKNQFSLDESMIPGHIPLKLAESILFVGKAISTVRKDTTALSPTTPALTIPSSKRRKQPLSLPPSLASAHLSLLLTLSRNPTGPTSLSTATQILHLHKTIHTIRRSTAEWLFRRVLVGEHDITRYLQSFKDYFLLGRGDFAVNLIEQFAGLRRAKLAAGSSVVTERKGTSSSSSSSQPATQQAAIQIKEQELNALLIKSSIGTLCEDDPDLDKFRLRLLTPQPTSVTLGASRRASKRPLPARASLGPLPPNKNATAHLFDDLLLGGVPLRLQYAVAWPLDLFLTEDEMTKYARLWSFLIGWKRIQWRLTQLWGVLRGGWVGGRRKKGGKGKKDKGAEEDEANKSIFYESEREKEREKIVWRVRSKMMFFVDAVWGHAQNDIIHTHFQSLLSRITPAMSSTSPDTSANPATSTLLDFEDIQMAHTAYLDTLLRGCLLESGVCAETMKDILRHCETFCVVVERVGSSGGWERRGSSMRAEEENWLEEVVRIEKDFSDQTGFLFRTLTGVNPASGGTQGLGGAPGQLDLLLTRLDYNKWFSVGRYTVSGGR